MGYVPGGIPGTLIGTPEGEEQTKSLLEYDLGFWIGFLENEKFRAAVDRVEKHDFGGKPSALKVAAFKMASKALGIDERYKTNKMIINRAIRRNLKNKKRNIGMKKILFIVLLTTLSFAGRRDVANNWKGIMDTVVMRNTLDSLSYKYTEPFVITDGEDMTITIKCNDTTAAGFASDSFNFAWGYQLGTLTRNSLGVLDTGWSGDNRFVVDTVRTDSLGIGRTGKTNTDGTTTRYYGGVDTLSITGYAMQDRWIVPEWRVIMRLWTMGLGGKQNRSTYTKIIFQLTQRVGVQIK